MERQKAELFEQEMALIKTRIMLNKLVALNLSLYHAILNYAERKGIPLTLDSNILRLAEEIEKTDIETFPQNMRLSDGISQRKEPDDNFPVPGNMTNW
jgi:hypothetical protein